MFVAHSNAGAEVTLNGSVQNTTPAEDGTRGVLVMDAPGHYTLTSNQAHFTMRCGGLSTLGRSVCMLAWKTRRMKTVTATLP
jgi:hypothetical protein